jgi:hypothetical protein
MDSSYLKEYHVQCNETECLGRILPATYCLVVPEVDLAADLVEIQSQEDECSEPARWMISIDYKRDASYCHTGKKVPRRLEAEGERAICSVW